jgi:hypothetical protein
MRVFDSVGKHMSYVLHDDYILLFVSSVFHSCLDRFVVVLACISGTL